MADKDAGRMPDRARQVAKRRPPALPIVSDTRFHAMLDVSDQTALSSIATVDTFPTGGMAIFSESEAAQYLYAIEAGMVRICRHLENGHRQILAFLWPGDIFGLTDDDGHYLNSASTLSEATIHRVPLGKLAALLPRNPELQFHLLVRANHDLRAAQRQIMTLGQHDIYRRLASFLIEMVQRAVPQEPESTQLRLPMSRTDIADYLGTTAETISRGLQRMEREGILRRVSPRVLEFDDYPGLSRLARR